MALNKQFSVAEHRGNSLSPWIPFNIKNIMGTDAVKVMVLVYCSVSSHHVSVMNILSSRVHEECNSVTHYSQWNLSKFLKDFFLSTTILHLMYIQMSLFFIFQTLVAGILQSFCLRSLTFLNYYSRNWNDDWSRRESLLGMSTVTMETGLSGRWIINIGYIISVSAVLIPNMHKRKKNSPMGGKVKLHLYYGIHTLNYREV